MRDAPSVGLLARLRAVLAADPRGIAGQVAEDGGYAPPAHLLRRMYRQRQAFLASWPWRWIPGALIPAGAFTIFGASDALLHAIDRDRRRWEAAQRSERPYWRPEHTHRARDDDPEPVAGVLEALREGRPAFGPGSMIREREPETSTT